RQVVLHIDAADWQATVYVNGKEVGTHRGGYDAFSFNISAALKLSGEQELVVAIWDPTDAGTQPRGKQVRKPGGIWYTPTSGIWQTVWLEPIPEPSLSELKFLPDIDAGELKISARVFGDTANVTIEAIALDGTKEVGRSNGPPGQVFKVPVPKAKLWSPD